jgi:hypothetical protein
VVSVTNWHIKNGYATFNVEPNRELKQLVNRIMAKIETCRVAGENPIILPMPNVFWQMCLERDSRSHSEYVGEGYSVWVQHCEYPACDKYLGVNYPDLFCTDHREPATSDATL